MNKEEMFKYVTPDLNPYCESIMCYKGVRCSQTPRVLQSLDRLYDATWQQPADSIVEIGTLYGAFTQILRDHDISEFASINTFDIVNTVATHQPGISYHYADVLNDGLFQVIDLIQCTGRVFVFCDGGNKELEVNVLCHYLKQGDLILCHDYVKHVDDLKDNDLTGTWSSYESQYDNIKDALTIAGCVPFVEDDMRRAMWGCFIKQ